MSDAGENFDDFEATAIAAPEETLFVAVDGFEGPLDLLLTLARNQKVDIAKISILKLADQYLEFIESAKKMNLELAADYLVMAAWLAYLKSRLILPQPPNADGEPTADEMATRLRWRLQRLEAMRAAAARLMARRPAGPRRVRARRARAGQCDQAAHLQGHALRPADRLCDAARQEAGRQEPTVPCMRRCLPIEEARERLERMLGRISDWSGLARLLPFEWSGGIAPALGAGQHLACLPGTGARRQAGNPPDGAVRSRFMSATGSHQPQRPYHEWSSPPGRQNRN